MARVLVTKFALTKGIVEAEAEIDGETATVTGAYPWDRTVLKLGEWYTDPDKAIARAKQMAVKKANDLEKQAASFRNMEFAFQTTLPT